MHNTKAAQAIPPTIAGSSSMPALHRQLENVWGELDQLRNSLDKLHARLTPILTPIPGQEAMPRCTPDGMSPVVDAMYRQAVSLASLTEQVNNIIDSLEV